MPSSSPFTEPLYIAGPTASGKSTLALAVAEELNGEIVNADAFQLYRGLEICSAQPFEADKERVPHHLYGMLAMDEACDAARYADLATAVITDILQRERLPIIVGGSGLYIKALTHGLSDLPSDAAVRTELAALNAEERVTRLLALDPAAEQTVNLKNDRYVSRALEICLLTGMPQSSLRTEWQQHTPLFAGVVLQWEREALVERIHQRVLNMVNDGLIAEIAALPTTQSTAQKAIGVHQVRRHLAGELSLDDAIEEIQTATRQYARRQRNWFRRETGFAPLPCAERMDTASLVHHIIAHYQTTVANIQAGQLQA